METIIEKRNGQTFISVTGRLDTVSAVEFQNQLDELHDTEVTHVVIDCAALEYISSSGLRAFISLLKRANKNGGNVSVVNMGSVVREVFDITGFSSLFGL